MLQANIAAIVVYPVKSGRGISVARAFCGELGLQNDRQWAVVDSRQQVLTQRETPALALISPSFDNDGRLILSAAGMPSLVVNDDRHNDTKLRLWGDDFSALDQGSEAAAWLTEYLERPCRLARASADFRRMSPYGKADSGLSQVAFSDCCPLLVMSVESLAELNERLATPVLMDRFRPSIVIEGAPAFSEDSATMLISGNVVLSWLKPCARCVVINIDEKRPAERDSEPLDVLAQYRSVGKEVQFGQYFGTSVGGYLQVGEPISGC